MNKLKQTPVSLAMDLRDQHILSVHIVCDVGGDVGAPGAVAHNESVSMVLGDQHKDETDPLGKARHESHAELVKLRITAGSPFTNLGHQNEKQVDMYVRVHLMSMMCVRVAKGGADPTRAPEAAADSGGVAEEKETGRNGAHVTVALDRGSKQLLLRRIEVLQANEFIKLAGQTWTARIRTRS